MKTDPDGYKIESALSPTPQMWSLTNGRYSVSIGREGTGHSSFDGLHLTRWSADPVEDDTGLMFFVRDLETGAYHTTPYSLSEPFEGTTRHHWSPGVIKSQRSAHGIDTELETCVLADQPMELRRIRLVNSSDRIRRFEVTSWCELVLSDPAAYAAHPEFSKLFLQTSYDSERGALYAQRRPRSAGEQNPFVLHAILDAPVEAWESSRVEFVGRGFSRLSPRALIGNAPLSNTTGNVLDPILCLRSTVEVAPHSTRQITFVLGAAADRLEAERRLDDLAKKPDLATEFDRAQDRERVVLRELEIDTDEAKYLQELAWHAMYGHPALRTSAQTLRRAVGDVRGLQEFGLSENRRFALVHASTPEDLAHGSRVARMSRYWRWHCVPIDIVVLDSTAEPAASSPVASSPAGSSPATPHVAQIIQASGLTPTQFDLLHACAHLVIQDEWPVLARLRKPRVELAAVDALLPVRRASAQALWDESNDEPSDRRPSSFRLTVRPAGPDPSLPPRPWVNVIANEHFGFLVSETGASSTWSINSRTHRLTPWNNDSLLDPHSEALYVRDDASGESWSPLPGPCPLPGDYQVEHGFGFSRFRHSGRSLVHDTIMFGARTEGFKVVALSVTNQGTSTRRLSLFSYCELLLGTDRPSAGRFVATEFDPVCGAILARNRLSGPFQSRVAFATAWAGPQATAVHYTCDRATFIGRGRSAANPLAISQSLPLDCNDGTALDPCMAWQLSVEIAPGATAQAYFVLGEGASVDEVHQTIDGLARPDALDGEWNNARSFWDRTLNTIRIDTPSTALNQTVNGWLLYQTLSCRLWGRTAFYQSGGAFGFRDQLQDVSALFLVAPELTRRQILLHASHQFEEGDVLHWWHPPTSEGIRTRFADDLLWLPYIVATYVETTGDTAVLDEIVPFMTARPLKPGEDEAYMYPRVSSQSASVYEHCCRALDRSLTRGSHGLPLFGTGDWNDGMNRVGREGRGESVWLGQFLYTTIASFLPFCDARGDEDRIRSYQAYYDDMVGAVNEAWDGAWYRRGYYDNGEPLGSSESAECRIDALTQAWAVLSKIAPPERSLRAVASVEEHLIDERAGLIRLLTPPFEHTPHDPGYIRGYVPGVRENGGQYTHAALWVVMALAELGQNHRVARYLEMLTPRAHTDSAEAISIYGLEPYVVAADVAGTEPHIGRGGWSWYTGSSGWMLRAVVESLLGLRMRGGDTFLIKPCIPDEWPGFTLELRLRGAQEPVVIEATNPNQQAKHVVAASLDGQPLAVEAGTCIAPVPTDGARHHILLILGSREGQ